MSFKTILHHPTVISIALAFYIAFVSYRLDHAIGYALRSWPLLEPLGYSASVVAAYVLADIIFKRWETRMRNRLLVGGGVVLVAQALSLITLILVRSAFDAANDL